MQTSILGLRRRARSRARRHGAPRMRTPARLPRAGRRGDLREVLKFLIDRTGYIKLLEEEDTPEAFSRIENLRELVNAAMDSRDRGETLAEFLDHAALVSDADHTMPRADHADDAARREGSGVPAGVPGAAWKRACSRTRARSLTLTTWKKSGAFATSA